MGLLTGLADGVEEELSEYPSQSWARRGVFRAWLSGAVGRQVP